MRGKECAELNICFEMDISELGPFEMHFILYILIKSSLAVPANRQFSLLSVCVCVTET